MDRDLCVLIGAQGMPLARTALGAGGLLSPGLSILSDAIDQYMLLWVPNVRGLFQDLKRLRLKSTVPHEQPAGSTRRASITKRGLTTTFISTIFCTH